MKAALFAGVVGVNTSAVFAQAARAPAAIAEAARVARRRTMEVSGVMGISEVRLEAQREDVRVQAVPAAVERRGRLALRRALDDAPAPPLRLHAQVRRVEREGV